VFGHQCLTERVVEFVGAAVEEVLAFEVYPGSVRLGERLRVVQRCRSSGEVPLEGREFRLELVVLLDLLVRLGQLVEDLVERFGHVAATVPSELVCFFLV